jgi:hypothetical protein
MAGTTQTTWCHIPEHLNPQQYYCENLKFSLIVKSAVFLAVTACTVVVGYLSVWKLLYIMLTHAKHFILVKWYLSTKPIVLDLRMWQSSEPWLVIV